MKKLKVGVIFGGRSGEHEVSLVSAESIMRALDKKKYDIIPIGITKEGEWIVDNFQFPISNFQLLEKFKKGKIKNGSRLPPKEILKVDVVFPAVHGTYAEDGTLQGLLEMLNIPYVGAGVLGSAVGMDKVVQKQLFEQLGLPVVYYAAFKKNQNPSNIVRHIEKKTKYPVFVKPACLGSSVGISKAKNKKELISAIKLAFKYDNKIIIEQAVLNTREIECAVLGNDQPAASVPGEIISSNEFYDYNAKYVDGQSKAVIPAKLPSYLVKMVQEQAIEACMAIEGAGMARVDFLLDDKSKKLFINEVNTIPGFTSISMYPKLWQATGLSYGKLLDKLIALALERHKEKQKLLFTYQPKKKWY
ncbi:MAG: D-alanine--D-alanine ligase family protein [bacterium]|nr:D-alanine--D-alanine ligase family protein [bacterium]